MGCLLDFLGVALGTVVVCVDAMDSDEVVVEVGVCGRIVVFCAESVANGWGGSRRPAEWASSSLSWAVHPAHHGRPSTS